MINIGGNISEVYVGSTSIEKAYIGSQLVFSKEPLPEFVEVEYIQNTSNAYIDTGIAFTELSPIKHFTIDIEITANASSWRTVFGTRAADGSSDGCFVQLDTSNIWRTRLNKTNLRINTITALGRHTVSVRNNMPYVDETAFYKSGGVSTYSSATITLLGTHNNNDNTVGTLGLKCKIFSCEIGNGTDLVRDYVPTYQTTTGLYGLLDKVNNVFYTSPNGTLFTGPSI